MTSTELKHQAGCRNGQEQFRIAEAADCQSGSGAGREEPRQLHTIAGNASYCLLPAQRRHCLKRLRLRLRNYQYQNRCAATLLLVLKEKKNDVQHHAKLEQFSKIMRKRK